MFSLFSVLLPVLVILTLWAIITALCSSASSGASPLPAQAVPFITGFLCVYSLALFLPGLALSVRRLHDIDLSGWMVLLGFVGLNVVLVVLAGFDSRPEANRWGPSPKGRGNTTSAP